MVNPFLFTSMGVWTKETFDKHCVKPSVCLMRGVMHRL